MAQEIRRFLAGVVQSNGGWKGLLGQLAIQAGTYAMAETVSDLGEQIAVRTDLVATLDADAARLRDEIRLMHDRMTVETEKFVRAELERGWCDAQVLDRVVEIEQKLRGDQEPIYGQRVRAAWRSRMSGDDNNVFRYLDDVPPVTPAPVDMLTADPAAAGECPHGFAPEDCNFCAANDRVAARVADQD